MPTPRLLRYSQHSPSWKQLVKMEGEGEGEEDSSNTTTRYFTIFPDDIIPVWTDFTPPEAWYDVIWVQWVMAHLTDGRLGEASAEGGEVFETTTLYVFQVDSGVMSLDIHPEHPYLIAVGLYDGTVAVYALKDKGSNPLYRSTAKTGKHTNPCGSGHSRSLSSERRHSGVVPREGVSGRVEHLHALGCVDF
ncbi:hypothetical protein EMCRGX_G008216 [Ephydatia muelleri]